MKSYREYVNEQDQIGGLDKPVFGSLPSGLGSARKRYNAAWDKASARNPDQFRKRNLLNRSRLQGGVEDNLEPYMGMTKTPQELSNVTNSMRNVIGRLRGSMMNKFSGRDTV